MNTAWLPHQLADGTFQIVRFSNGRKQIWGGAIFENNRREKKEMFEHLAALNGDSAARERIASRIIAELKAAKGNQMKITWTKNEPSATYSSQSGIDEDGNRYYETANKEIVEFTPPDGRTGQGWTAQEALHNE